MRWVRFISLGSNRDERYDQRTVRSMERACLGELFPERGPVEFFKERPKEYLSCGLVKC